MSRYAKSNFSGGGILGIYDVETPTILKNLQQEPIKDWSVGSEQYVHAHYVCQSHWLHQRWPPVMAFRFANHHCETLQAGVKPPFWYTTGYRRDSAAIRHFLHVQLFARSSHVFFQPRRWRRPSLMLPLQRRPRCIILSTVVTSLTPRHRPFIEFTEVSRTSCHQSPSSPRWNCTVRLLTFSGTLASQAEIGSWVQAPGTLLRGSGGITPGTFLSVHAKILQCSAFFARK